MPTTNEILNALARSACPDASETALIGVRATLINPLRVATRAAKAEAEKAGRPLVVFKQSLNGHQQGYDILSTALILDTLIPESDRIFHNKNGRSFLISRTELDLAKSKLGIEV